MGKSSNVKYNLRGINTDEFSMFEENLDVSKKISLNTRYTYGINEDENEFVVIIKFSFEIDNKSFLAIKASFFYEIEQDSWNSLVSKNKIKFPKYLVGMMIGIGVGTIRGILFEKTKSTPFQKYIIPKVMLDEVIKNDVEFNLN